MAERVIFGLGSNLGDRVENIRKALDEIAATFEDLHVASIYETDPQDDEDQAPFLNTAASALTTQDPPSVYLFVRTLENALGRTRDPARRNGPRTIDVDILLFGARALQSPDIILPHPRLRDRKFALVPLLEIAPDQHDPVDGTRYADILAHLPPQGIYYFGSSGYSHA